LEEVGASVRVEQLRAYLATDDSRGSDDRAVDGYA
jgi:hypothetical protein